MIDLSTDYERLYCPDEVKIFLKAKSEDNTDLVAYPSYLKNNKIRNIGSCGYWTDDINSTIDTPRTYKNEFITGYKVLGISKDRFYENNEIELLDPRGFIICITPKNFLSLLEKTNIINGYLDGAYKFAFHTYSSTNVPLRLIGHNTLKEKAEYTTKLLESKIKASDLKIGYKYIDKQGYTLTYLGKIKVYNLTGTSTEYIFSNKQLDDKVQFINCKSVTNFAIEDGLDTSFMETNLLEEYKKTQNLSPIVNFGFLEICSDNLSFAKTQHVYLYRACSDKIFYLTVHTAGYDETNIDTLLPKLIKNIKHSNRPPQTLYSIQLNNNGIIIKEEGTILEDSQNLDNYSLGYYPFVEYQNKIIESVYLWDRHISKDTYTKKMFLTLFEKNKSTKLI